MHCAAKVWIEPKLLVLMMEIFAVAAWAGPSPLALSQLSCPPQHRSVSSFSQDMRQLGSIWTIGPEETFMLKYLDQLQADRSIYLRTARRPSIAPTSWLSGKESFACGQHERGQSFSDQKFA